MDWSSIKEVVIPEGNVKQIAKGSQILWKAGQDLPYTELQWIKSVGGQYIDTGLIVDNVNKFYMEFEYLSAEAITNSHYFAGASGTTGKRWSPNLGSGVNLRVYGGSGNVMVAEPMPQDVKLTLELSKTQVIYNGSQTFTISVPTGITDKILIFAGATTGTIYTKLRMYKFQMYDTNNVLVRDMIPCKRKSDNVVCMYDKVSEQFFTNAGTGSFIAGPEKNK